MLFFSPNHQTMHSKSVWDLTFSDSHIRLIILKLDRISFARYVSPPDFLPTFPTLAAGRSCIGKMHRVLPGWIHCLDMFFQHMQGSRILDFGTVESLRFSPQRWLEKLQIQPFPDPDHNAGSSYSIFYLHILVLQTISSWRIAELTSIMQESLDCMGDVPCPQGDSTVVPHAMLEGNQRQRPHDPT